MEGGNQVLHSAASKAVRKERLPSPGQHSSTQRDFIDQRTAMQEPLLHPNDTIYHAPSFPALFSPHRLSVQPIMQKRDKKKPWLIIVQMIGGLNAKPVTFQQDITNGLCPTAPKATS